MKKKKVLFCINELSMNSVGISFLNLINRLDYTQYDVDLIFVNSQTQLINQIPRNVNIIFSPYDKAKINFINKIKFFHRYDLSVMYDIGDPSLCEIVKMSSKNNYVYLHKNYPGIYLVKERYNEFISSHKILDFKGYIFPNEAIMKKFISVHPDKEPNSVVLEYVIDDNHIKTMSKASVGVDKPDRCTLLTFVGSINDRAKNFTLMIKLMADIIKVNNKVRLWIIGDGPDLVNIRMMVTQNHLDEYVTLFGFKSNPYPYMALADYYLNTSDIFDASTSLIEARVLEKPIITTNIDVTDKNMHVVSSDPSLIAKEVNNLILSNTRYEGTNNFWQENQTILRKFDQLIK